MMAVLSLAGLGRALSLGPAVRRMQMMKLLQLDLLIYSAVLVLPLSTFPPAAYDFGLLVVDFLLPAGHGADLLSEAGPSMEILLIAAEAPDGAGCSLQLKCQDGASLYLANSPSGRPYHIPDHIPGSGSADPQRLPPAAVMHCFSEGVKSEHHQFPGNFGPNIVDGSSLSSVPGSSPPSWDPASNSETKSVTPRLTSSKPNSCISVYCNRKVPQQENQDHYPLQHKSQRQLHHSHCPTPSKATGAEISINIAAYDLPPEGSATSKTKAVVQPSPVNEAQQTGPSPPPA
ncbi:hypothetical protein Nepgr_022942 [Nepenthes gracilis]|uniref:Uncharacterized protein n=1 Tax=Nepenthes gracilis TaxID=150966 RepID=A0AAD3T1K1_NEPGR|nr:hypothetical protein Nepgr_022942 [Nepenthes gracilis]